MIRLIKNILGKTIKFIYRITYKLIPTHKKTILFIAFHGRGYSDNPRAIYEYMRQQDQFKDYRFIWAIKHHKKKNISIENGSTMNVQISNNLDPMTKENMMDKIGRASCRERV